MPVSEPTVAQPLSQLVAIARTTRRRFQHPALAAPNSAATCAAAVAVLSTVPAIPETVTLPVPFRVVKRSGRREMQLPEGAVQSLQTDNTLVKALARAFRWRKMLDEAVYTTIEEIARAKGINAIYLSRILRLSLLAPDIVEAILDGRQSMKLRLDDLLTSLPLEWEAQRGLLGN